MAYERKPNDAYRLASDPDRASLPDDEFRNAAALDNKLQPDPELAEGPASNGRIAIFTVGIAVILGVVFYGLNNTSIIRPGTSTAQNTAQPTTKNTPKPSIAQNTAQPSPQAAPPGMRDVTPRANTSPGVTTGAAPAHPQAPPSAAPTGPDVNRSGNPPTTVPPNK